MPETLRISIYYHDGQFYLPTALHSVDGVYGEGAPVAVVPAGDVAALAEAIEEKAI